MCRVDPYPRRRSGFEPPRRTPWRRGVSLLELVIVVAIVGVLSAIAPLALRSLERPARDAAIELAGHVKLVRARAMATTSAMRLVVAETDALRVETAPHCAAASDGWSEEERLSFRLRPATAFVALEPGTELVCFDARGIGDASPTIEVRDGRGRTETVDLFAGGSVELR